MIATATSSMSESPPFRYIGGAVALDLVNTVDWTVTGMRNDRLTSYESLTAWARGAGVITPAEAQQLCEHVEAEPGRGRDALEKARSVRLILRLVFLGVMRGEDGGLEGFSELLGDTLPRLRVERWGQGARYAWADWGGDPCCLLWPVIFMGAELLTSEEAAQVGMCAGDDCGWLFVDRSRNGLRRWCAMATCGTKAKNRRRRGPGRSEPTGERLRESRGSPEVQARSVI